MKKNEQVPYGDANLANMAQELGDNGTDLWQHATGELTVRLPDFYDDDVPLSKLEAIETETVRIATKYGYKTRRRFNGILLLEKPSTVQDHSGCDLCKKAGESA